MAAVLVVLLVVVVVAVVVVVVEVCVKLKQYTAAAAAKHRQPQKLNLGGPKLFPFAMKAAAERAATADKRGHFQPDCKVCPSRLGLRFESPASPSVCSVPS